MDLSIITDEIQETMFNFIKEEAKKKGEGDDACQILIESTSGNKNNFFLCYKGQKERETSINEIRKIKFVDFTGKSLFIENFIEKITARLSDKHEIPLAKVRLLLGLFGNSEKKSFLVCLFNEGDFVKDYTISKLIS
jgi:hypothetical protein